MIGPQASDRTSARFEVFYRGRYQEIAAYVRRRIADDAADDVIANVFTVAWRRFGEVPGPPQDRPWLFAVARNTISDHNRAQRRWFRLAVRLTALAARPVAQPGSSYDCEPVLAAMAALRPAEREALQLVHWEELSHAEAAAVLGCTVNAFELRYRRARHALRAAVARAPVAGAAVASAPVAGAPSSITGPGSVSSIRNSASIGRHVS
jgi:RNA polymerase sigma factor (sigma-70 family)